MLRRSSCPQALALRVRIIRAAAAGQRTAPLARQLGGTPKTARKWRSRWVAAEGHLAATDDARPALERALATVLADAPRAGAPAPFTAEQIVHRIDRAGRPPEQVQRPRAAWTPRELADDAAKQGLVTRLAPRTVGRCLTGGRAAAPAQALLAQGQGQAGRS